MENDVLSQEQIDSVLSRTVQDQPTESVDAPAPANAPDASTPTPAPVPAAAPAPTPASPPATAQPGLAELTQRLDSLEAAIERLVRLDLGALSGNTHEILEI